MHQIRNLIINVQPENQYAVSAETKVTLLKFADSNTENNRELKKIQNQMMPNKATQSSR